MRLATFHLLLGGILCGIVLAGCGNGTSRPRPNPVNAVSNNDNKPKDETSKEKKKGKTGEPGGKKTQDTSVAQAKPRDDSPGAKKKQGRSRLALPTGDEKTSFLVVETIAPKRNQKDRPYQYKIVLKNISTTIGLANVRVTQRVHQEMTIADAKLGVVTADNKTPKGRRNNTTLPARPGEEARAIWTFSLLEPGETGTITVTASGAVRGNLANYVGIQYDPLLRFVTEITEPEIHLTKKAPGFVDNCKKIKYTYILENKGNQAMKDLRVTDKLHEGLTTAEGKKGVVVWELAKLAGSDKAELTVTVEAEGPGTYSSGATVTGPEGLHMAADAVATQVRLGKLQVIAKVDHKQQYTGQKITYSVTVKNAGDAKVEKPKLTGTLGKGALQRGTGTQWNLPPLGPGQVSKPVSVVVTSNTPGELKSIFAASFDCDGKPRDAKPFPLATQIKKLDLKVAVLSSEGKIQQGDSFTCSVQLSNEGTSAYEELDVSLHLPGFVEFEEASGDAIINTFDPATRRVKLAAVKELPPGGKRIWRVRVKAKDFSKGLFTAHVKSKSLDNATVSFESDEVQSVEPVVREPLTAPPPSKPR